MKTGLEITGLSATYDAHGEKNSISAPPLLNDLRMRVGLGKIAVVVGASGSGKTTLLNCIAGLHAIHAGYIVLCGDSKRGAIEHSNDKLLGTLELRRIGIAFQQSNLWSHLCVRDNLIHPQMKLSKVSRADATEWANYLLRELVLDEHGDKSVNALSGGQRQRVAIARALSLRPDMLLFDEITANQDPENVQRIVELIRHYMEKSGCTAVTVSHDMSFVRRVADTVHFLHDGVIRMEATPEVFFNNPQDDVIQRFLSAL